MNFAHPQMLWLMLIALPLLTWFLWWSWRKKERLVAQFVHSRLLASLTIGTSTFLQKTRLILVILAVALLFLALARPQWGYAWEEATHRGIDIVVAVDTSRSMLAEDIPPNRLTRAKLATLDLLRLARNDRLGLVAFAGAAFLQCPLTIDASAFRQNVEALDTTIIPEGGTALAEAIQTAVKAFQTEGNNHRVIILITDGEDHEPGAVAAAEHAAGDGIRIYTIGIGTAEGELLRARDQSGALNYIRDPHGNVVKSRLNEPLLKQIANAAQGFYLHLDGPNPMETLYTQALAPLPKAELGSTLFRRFQERFQWPLGFALLFLMLEVLLPDRKRAAKHKDATPLRATPPFQKPALASLLLFAALISLAASPASALRKYQSGDYLAAQQEFERLLQKNPDDPRLLYNAGVAAYQSGDFETAAAYFAGALESHDLELQQRAHYNLGNSFYRRGEQITDPSQKIPAWQQAARQYDAALKLNEADSDSEHNLSLVRKRLEELQQSQPPPPQPQPEPQDEPEQDQQDQPDQQPPPECGDDQQSSDSQPDQPSPEPPDDQQNGPDSDSPHPSQDEGQQDQNDSGQNGDRPDQQESAENGETPAPQGQMTPEQAKQLLDSQKAEEKTLPYNPADKGKPRHRVLKDW